MPGPVTSTLMTSSTDMGTTDPSNTYDSSRGVLDTKETKDASGRTMMGAWVADTDDDKQYLQVNTNSTRLTDAIL